MEVEVIKWVAGILIVPLIVFAFAILSILRDIKKSTDILIAMHNSPDVYGFGTKSIGDCMREMRDAFQDQSHYMKWMVAELTGKKPPPPVHHPNHPDV